MDFKFIIFLIPAYLYLIVRLKKSIHMLQQNRYNGNRRYLKWMKRNVLKTYKFLELFVILFFKIPLVYSILYLFLFIQYYLELKNEQSKKPLVITMRIKRLLVTLFIIYLIPLILFKSYIIVSLQIFFTFYLVWLANLINTPIEKQVFYHYRRQALKRLKALKNMKIIGITGSYGKTSSKNILNDILNVRFNSYATPQSINTPYGTINIINNYLDKFNDIFISEMGAFKRGEIKEMCDLVQPKYGILTKIGVAHLEIFGSIENVQKGKFELIESLPKDGIGILNKDDEYQVNYKLKNDCKIVWIGIDNKEADVRATNIKLSHKGTNFDVVFKDIKKKYKFSTKLLGKANIYNILAGIALGRELGLSIEELQQGVKMVNFTPHRLELKTYSDIYIIDDAYNSNPVGSKMALDVLKMMPGKRIVVTPGMIDLGEKQKELNKEFGKQIAKVADEVILIGRNQTKPIKNGLLEAKYKLKNIHILNDVQDAFLLIQKLKDKSTYVLLENDLPDMFNE